MTVIIVVVSVEEFRVVKETGEDGESLADTDGSAGDCGDVVEGDGGGTVVVRVT